MRNYSIKLGGQGLSFGSAYAMAIGYGYHHSIGWTIVDGLLSWLYVIYRIL